MFLNKLPSVLKFLGGVLKYIEFMIKNNFNIFEYFFAYLGYQLGFSFDA